ncbi:ATP synthase F1, epsilon subunit [Corynebacterium simulans]|uniref:ATP synthase epsilon chain n=1 Tax=Corynebacterium accolens TaxID=38284 RepID=A0A2A4AKI1_9CORY|nr:MULTISPECIES: F0F1 ATP synthase subunit epsilon [Corynebacterium]AMO88033.1 ATP synthase F1, epsilon subunit [Corynebacterium simulans]MCG7246769.1 F0F1 ATP synthase subunit epsilon [Corynebacterium simulans]OHO68203.1 F0F1 ATP synthase subunit epsilon [Corynebacterium sp. HMSC036D03]PCC82904.1 F0F1 ATP synthase subunit epsilon [Corynebacterium accolens]
MADITAELVSVERKLWAGKATLVTAETTEGEIGVLPGHEPLVGQLADNGVVTIHPVDGERLVAAVQGGFLSVSKDKITVLANWATWSTEVDEAQASEDQKSEEPIVHNRGEAAQRALRRAKG